MASDINFVDSKFDSFDDNPVIREFQQAVERDPNVKLLLQRMFEVLATETNTTGEGMYDPVLHNPKQMFCAFGALLSHAPKYDTSSLPVGCPFSNLLKGIIATPSGSVFFLNDTVNYHLKKILHHWGEFLKSPASCHVLTDDPKEGWLGKSAMEKMPSFAVQYKCNVDKPHYGFQSWDDFFTREFRDGVRPISAPHDDRVIVHACESAPYRIQLNVQSTDIFSIKSDSYFLDKLLGDESAASLFVGGTLYQAYLSSTSYHRWHSPVSGKITRAYVKEGAYFSVSPAIEFDESWLSQQVHVAHVATRAVIYIQAHNKDIGLMVFLGVGMGEVSSCEITVEVGQDIKKGQQIGMFHFGGSTYCLIFGPNVKIEFNLHGQSPGINSTNLPVNSLLATVQ